MSWLNVRGNAAPEIETELSSEIRAAISSGKFSEKDISYVGKLFRPIVPNATSELTLSEKELELLRLLCSQHAVQIPESVKISSHRKLVGPIIVGFKKLLLPIVSALLKDTIRDQRAFNATCVRLVAEILRNRR